MPQDLQALMLAMGMQESTHLDVRERDASKDNRTDKSANATLFNLSVVRAPAVHAPEGALLVAAGVRHGNMPCNGCCRGQLAAVHQQQ